MRNDSMKTAGDGSGELIPSFFGDEFKDWLKLNEAIDEVGQVSCSNFPDIYFPDQTEGKNAELALAKRMCGECPIRNLCVAFAMKHDVQGIWGGVTQAERNQIKRLMRRS
jgi:hypothetical protein